MPESVNEESLDSLNDGQEAGGTNPSTPLLPFTLSQLNQGPLLQTNANPVATTTLSEVTMPDGSKIQVHAQAQEVNDLAEFVQITSEERVKLDAKQQADLRFAITRKQHDLFQKMDLASTNIDELVGFQSGLDTAERHFQKFDLFQIFQIVDPEEDLDGKIKSSLKSGSDYQSLFQWYAILTVEEVMASNEWYRTFPTASWYGENMGLTYEYLKTHMTTELWQEVKDEYNGYPAKGKGGPLLLYLMIHHLIAANDSIAITLSKKIDTVKISSYKGEDVSAVVTHLRAIIRRLQQMRRRDAAGNQIDLVPLDLTKRLYSVFQTSSSLEFNNLFQNRYSFEYAESLASGNKAWSEPEKVLNLALNLYTRLCADDNWVGTNQNKSTFSTTLNPKAATSTMGTVKCHNCGGPHYLRDCPVPRDKARIDANRQKMDSTRRQTKNGGNKSKGSGSKQQEGHPPGGKFPQKPSKGQPNRCEVDGKPYYFHYKSNTWRPADRQANLVDTVQAVGTSSSLGMYHQATSTAPATSACLAERNLIISNLTNQFADAMAALSSTAAGGIGSQ
jgi:hypothetical protein